MKSLAKIAVCTALPAIIANAALAAEAPNLAQRAVAEYLELAKFPEWSLPIPAGAINPILSERSPAVITQAGPNGAGPALSVWLDEVRYELGDSVSIYAQLHDRPLSDADLLTTPQADARGPWSISGELVSQAGDALAALSFTDDGKGADERAGDGVFTASYTLNETAQPAVGQANNLAYRVTASNDAQETRIAFGGFQYSHPAAHLTGKYSDRLENGNLIISAQVDVKQAGRVHLAGVINNALGTPIALSQHAAELEEGLQWIDLPVYGLLLRNTASPFTVGSLTLTTTRGMPNALGEVAENVHKTAAYLPTAFTDKPFDRVNLLDAAARLQAIANP